MKTINLTYDFDEKAYLAFQKYYMSNSKRYKKIKLLRTFLFPIIFLCFLLFRYFYLGQIDLVFFWILFVSSILWILLYPKFLDRGVLKNALKTLKSENNSLVLWKQELEISKDFLFLKTSWIEEKIDLEKIYKIYNEKDYIFIYITSASAFAIEKNQIKKELEKLLKFLKDNFSDKLDSI